MRARSPHEPHRTATPLELLFDLVFVVAIAEAASGLHHAIVENHAADGLIGYAMVFFAIWWAWMNFTWFASAYDTDDLPYRLAVFVQITGALILAGGVPAMFEARMPNVAVIGGYVVMRLALVVQWLRASVSDPDRRVTARRYAAGIAAVQVAWVALPFLPWPGFPCSSSLPSSSSWCRCGPNATRATSWHPHHIAERYGLLTLIVLGESILSATAAVQSALAGGERLSALVPIIAGGMLIVYSLWWVYFDRPAHDLLTTMPAGLRVGLRPLLRLRSGRRGRCRPRRRDRRRRGARGDRIGGSGSGGGGPGGDYLVCLWILHDRPEYGWTRALGPTRRGGRAAHAVHGATRLVDRGHARGAGRRQAGGAAR